MNDPVETPKKISVRDFLAITSLGGLGALMAFGYSHNMLSADYIAQIDNEKNKIKLSGTATMRILDEFCQSSGSLPDPDLKILKNETGKIIKGIKIIRECSQKYYDKANLSEFDESEKARFTLICEIHNLQNMEQSEASIPHNSEISRAYALGYLDTLAKKLTAIDAISDLYSLGLLNEELADLFRPTLSIHLQLTLKETRI